MLSYILCVSPRLFLRKILYKKNKIEAQNVWRKLKFAFFIFIYQIRNKISEKIVKSVIDYLSSDEIDLTCSYTKDANSTSHVIKGRTRIFQTRKLLFQIKSRRWRIRISEIRGKSVDILSRGDETWKYEVWEEVARW